MTRRQRQLASTLSAAAWSVGPEPAGPLPPAAPFGALAERCSRSAGPARRWWHGGQRRALQLGGERVVPIEAEDLGVGPVPGEGEKRRPDACGRRRTTAGRRGHRPPSGQDRGRRRKRPWSRSGWSTTTWPAVTCGERANRSDEQWPPSHSSPHPAPDSYAEWLRVRPSSRVPGCWPATAVPGPPSPPPPPSSGGCSGATSCQCPGLPSRR